MDLIEREKSLGLFVGALKTSKDKVKDRAETAAVHDWLNETHVYLRPSYKRKEDLIKAIASALQNA